MILKSIYRGLSNATKMARNAVSLAKPHVTKGAKTVRDYTIAEVKNLKKAIKDDDFSQEKEMEKLSSQMSKSIWAKENRFIEK